MYKRIMVAVDGSHTSLRGLQEAIALARDQAATLRILHVIDEFALVQFPGLDGGGLYVGDMMRMQAEAGKAVVAAGLQAAEAAGVHAEGEAVEWFSGPVWQCIVEQAAKWKAELLVLGTHGRRGFNRMFMGSDAERVLRLASMPILLVRASEKDAVQAGAPGQAQAA